jgi:hypothetical protein
MPLARTLLAASTLVCLFYACKKEDFPENDGTVLQRVVTDNDSLLSITFHYDGQNRLIALIDSNRQGHVDETSIEYNTAGNPVKFTMHHHYRSNPIDSKREDSLVYVNNRVVKKLYKSPTTAYKLLNAYSYDGNGRLITDTAYSYFRDVISGYTQLSYDNNDDIVQYQFFDNSSGVMDNVGSTIVTYNSDVSPYKSLGLAYYFVTGDYLLLSKHNKTKVVQNWRYLQPYTTEYSYEYNSNRLLKNMLRSRSYGNQPYGVTAYNFYYR